MVEMQREQIMVMKENIQKVVWMRAQEQIRDSLHIAVPEFLLYSTGMEYSEFMIFEENTNGCD